MNLKITKTIFLLFVFSVTTLPQTIYFKEWIVKQESFENAFNYIKDKEAEILEKGGNDIYSQTKLINLSNEFLIKYKNLTDDKDSSYLNLENYFMYLGIARISLDTYMSRGILKGKGGDYWGCIEDLTESINLIKKFKFSDRKYETLYFLRGIAYYNIDRLNQACNDWRVSVNYGNRDAMELLKKYCRQDY